MVFPSVNDVDVRLVHVEGRPAVAGSGARRQPDPVEFVRVRALPDLQRPAVFYGFDLEWLPHYLSSSCNRW